MNFNKFRLKSRYFYNIPCKEDFNNNERWAKRNAYTLVCPHAKRLCDFTHNQIRRLDGIYESVTEFKFLS